MKRIEKNVLSCFTLCFLFYSCSVKSVDREYYTNGSLKTERITLNPGDSIRVDYKLTGDTIEKKIYFSSRLKEHWRYSNNSPFTKQIYYSEKRSLLILYFENGRINTKYEMLDGKKNGIEESYFENGTKRTITHYKNDQPIGEFMQFYENGQLYISTNNVGNGTTYLYDSLGNLMNQLEYRNFELVDTN